MNYQQVQRLCKERARTGRRCKLKNNTHINSVDGLLGVEYETLKTMFSDDGKTPIKFKKLNNLQKKVLRKMNMNKLYFLLKTNFKNK